MSDPSTEARLKVQDCEREIGKIKETLRGLGTGGEPNSLKIVLTKAEGLAEGAQPRFSLQLSSPVEEATLTKVFDPQNADEEGSSAVFKGVELSVATVIAEAKDAEIPLGFSAPQDLASIFTMDAMTPQEQYVTELVLPFHPNKDSASALEAKEEKPQEDKPQEAKEDKPQAAKEGDSTPEGKKDNESAGDASSAPTKDEGKDTAPEEQKAETTTETSKGEPVCKATFQVTFKPSTKDQRDALYELLNKASQKKSAAIAELRQISAKSSTQPSALSKGKPAVKAGFLNQKKKEPNRLQQWYERTLGPKSFLRQAFPIAKDYIIFFGFVALVHFRGEELALPVPT